jgi:chromosome partitioning protein
MDMNSPREDSRLAPLELTPIFGVSLQAIHKQMKKLEIRTSIVKSKSYLGSESTRKIFEDRGFRYPRKIVSFQIVKGGTGKTTTIREYNFLLSSQNHKYSHPHLYIPKRI